MTESTSSKVAHTELSAIQAHIRTILQLADELESLHYSLEQAAVTAQTVEDTNNVLTRAKQTKMVTDPIVRDIELASKKLIPLRLPMSK